MKITIRTNSEIVLEIEKATPSPDTPSNPLLHKSPDDNPEPSSKTKRRLGPKPSLDPEVLKEVKDKILDMILFSEIRRDHNVPLKSLFNNKQKMRKAGELTDDIT
jgi:hypothetical protein